MRVSVPVEIPDVRVNITLAPEDDLMVTGEAAAQKFSVSERTLEKLARRYPDFPSIKVGRSRRYLVPDLYAWFRDFGGEIDTE